MYDTPVIPSPTRAGVLGIALTTLVLIPRLSLIESIVIPGAIDITTLSSLMTLTIFFITALYTCGLTANTIYWALLAHSALLSAYLTPVSSLILLHLSRSGQVNIISDGSNTLRTPLSIAYPILPIPIKPIFAILPAPFRI